MVGITFSVFSNRFLRNFPRSGVKYNLPTSLTVIALKSEGFTMRCGKIISLRLSNLPESYPFGVLLSLSYKPTRPFIFRNSKLPKYHYIWVYVSRKVQNISGTWGDMLVWWKHAGLPIARSWVPSLPCRLPVY